MDGGGIIYEGENVQKAFVTHYENFLRVNGDISLAPTSELFQNRLDTRVANNMVRPISDEEVRKAMFSIGRNKYPGPYGYSAAFFIHAWPIVGVEVTDAIKDFFNKGKLLQE
ncbi:hypothetical protein QVD17_39385 [Tagetes erecta]|uniref:Uncharacterized protein n=1 Tax=Tagetes erecta TaxID=13708 RepID=A0AAD8JQN0_TARER|nr:hypothetical protein QVD17_39385 [Tagetes erecta]